MARTRETGLMVTLAVALIAALVLALTVTSPQDATGVFTLVVGLIAVGGIGALALVARPCWPLSLGLALGVFSGHWADMGIPFPLHRLLLLVAIFSALGRQWLTRPEGLRTRPVDWLLTVTALYVVCSTILAGTLDDAGARFTLLDRFSLIAFLLFFVAPFAYREARDRQVLLGVLVALGAYLGLTALIETVGPRGLLFPRYIDDPAVGIHFDRARGPLVEAAGNGLVLYTCAVAAVIAAVTWRDRRWRGLAAAVAALCVLGALFTLTRSVWLAAAGGTLGALLFARETRRYVLPAGVLGALVVAIAFAAVPGFADRADTRSNDDRPLWDRYNSNAAALRMLEQRPAVGFGWGRFATDSADYYRQGQDYPLTSVRDVHNVFLSNAAELGLLGAGLWLLSLLTAIAGGVMRRGPPVLRPWRIGLVAVATSYLLAALTTPLGFAAPTLLLWVWAGVTWTVPAPEELGSHVDERAALAAPQPVS